MPTENKSELWPWEPSPLVKQRQSLQKLGLGIGAYATEHNIPFLRALDDPYYTRNLAENLTFASEFIPGFGDIQGFREGRHMMEEGSPKHAPGQSFGLLRGQYRDRPETEGPRILGATMMAASMLPFIPFTPIKKALERGLKVTPTKVVRTNTGPKAVTDKFETMLSAPDYNYTTVAESLKEGRLNFETNAERQLLSNPDFANPNKAYDVDEFIKSTVSKSPTVIQTTVRNQLDEWVSPALRGKKATIQEILDDIGTNKPTIKENYMDEVNQSRNQYMPHVPTTTPVTNPAEALETIYPSNYTERSFSVHSPRYGKLFDDPGHREVGQGTMLRDSFHPSEDVWNTANRIFTTRSGVYDIDGVKTYIPAEGQSGVYMMGTSGKKALRDVTTQSKVSPDTIESMLHDSPEVMEDITRYLDNPYPIKLLNHADGTLENIVPPGLPSKDEFLRLLGESGHTLDEWNALVKEQREYMAKRIKEIRAEKISETGENVFGRTQRQAHTLAKEDSATRFVPQFTRMIPITAPGARNLPTSAPLFKEWFPMHMKTSLNDAVEVGADVVRFPINDYAIAKTTGQTIYPARANAWADEFTPDMDIDDMALDWIPSEESQVLGKMYKQRTKEGFKRIEAEYGIKLNPTEIMDDNNNLFLEIALTPELKEAFKTVVYNRGGAVYKKPLMNLKY
jgi:hypothetical protein